MQSLPNGRDIYRRDVYRRYFLYRYRRHGGYHLPRDRAFLHGGLYRYHRSDRVYGSDRGAGLHRGDFSGHFLYRGYLF